MGIEITTTSDGVREAAALLADAVLEPTFREADIDLERRIALAEIALTRDDPQDIADESSLRAAWGSHPLARPVIGTEETLAALTPEVLVRRHRSLVRSGGVLAVAVGDLEMEDLRPLLDRLPLDRPLVRRLPGPPSWQGGRVVRARPAAEQAYVRMAFPAPGSDAPERAVLAVLNRILGGGQSSRLFQRVREEEGLAYDIASGIVAYPGSGLLEIGWGCDPARLNAVREVVAEEIERFAGTVGSDDVDVAVEGMLRGLAIDADDVAGRAALEAGWLFEHGEVFSVERAEGEIRAVTVEAVQALARRVLDTARMAMAIVGPEETVERVA